MLSLMGGVAAGGLATGTRFTVRLEWIGGPGENLPGLVASRVESAVGSTVAQVLGLVRTPPLHLTDPHAGAVIYMLTASAPIETPSVVAEQIQSYAKTVQGIRNARANIETIGAWPISPDTQADYVAGQRIVGYALLATLAIATWAMVKWGGAAAKPKAAQASYERDY